MQGSLNRVLYVEDDEIIAELAIMAMEDFGNLTVRHCLSGREALAIVSEFQPELVLLDMMMPDMDGMDTLKHLRKLPEGASLPAVFMSAKVQAHEQEAYLNAGANGVIAKPFDPLELSNKLQEIWLAAQ